MQKKIINEQEKARKKRIRQLQTKLCHEFRDLRKKGFKFEEIKEATKTSLETIY